MNLKESVQRLVKDELGESSPVEAIDKLHGDASYRTYYRARLASGRSLIVMEMPKGKASASEEITNFNGTHKELPFINVERFLSKVKLPVPMIHAYSDEDHIMVLEDLGNRSMCAELTGAGRKKTLDWYRRAIDLLVEMQQRTSGAAQEDCVALARSFDASLLNWEFQHFLEYGIEARTGMPMDEGDLEVFERKTREISRGIEGLPYGFTHRDFQSRNLLI